MLSIDTTLAKRGLQRHRHTWRLVCTHSPSHTHAGMQTISSADTCYTQPSTQLQATCRRFRYKTAVLSFLRSSSQPPMWHLETRGEQRDCHVTRVRWHMHRPYSTDVRSHENMTAHPDPPTHDAYPAPTRRLTEENTKQASTHTELLKHPPTEKSHPHSHLNPQTPRPMRHPTGTDKASKYNQALTTHVRRIKQRPCHDHLKRAAAH